MDFDSFFHPLSLSRKLSEQAARLGRFEKTGRGTPFAGLFPGKTTYEQVLALAADDPLRAHLLRWVHRLAEARITFPLTARLPWLLRGQTHPLRQPVFQKLCLDDMRRGCLRSEGEELCAWSRSYHEHADELASVRVELWTTFQEISSQLGEPEPLRFWDPISPGEEESVQPQLELLAKHVLDCTDELAEHIFHPGWEPLLQALKAPGAGEGWPARLAPDTLRDLLPLGELFSGVRLELGQLPQRSCPMSFPRALAQVGRELCWVLRPLSLPEVVARDPDDLLGHQCAFLFAQLSCTRSFQMRMLGLSRSQAELSRRHFVVGWLAHLRLSAAKALLHAAAFSGLQTLREAHETLGEQLLRAAWPSQSVFATCAPRRDEPSRLAASLSALDDLRRRTERHDEDWWRSPHAQEELRAELSAPAALTVGLSTCQAGLDQLLKEAAQLI